MEITVRLLATYRRFLPNSHDARPVSHPGTRDAFSLRVAPDATVDTALSVLPIPPEEAFTVFVNGRHAEGDQPLQAGDVLTVFPAAGGG